MSELEDWITEKHKQDNKRLDQLKYWWAFESFAAIATGVLIAFAFERCQSTTFYHDKINPCLTGDTVECNKWKCQYPNEYNRFLKRIEPKGQ